jgi:hypothetical protein
MVEGVDWKRHRDFDGRQFHFGNFVREDGARISVFDDMTVFVRAAEVGSFSGAAQQLGIAKSIVSRRILSLESRLGTSMFHPINAAVEPH